MAISAVPTEAISIYNNALELSNRGDLENALNEYNKAVSIHPSFVQAFNNIGEIHSQMGNREEAITSYLEALKIDRNDRVLLNLGVEVYNNGNYEKALPYFIESVSLSEDFLEANYYCAMTYYNLKDLKNSESYFSKVITLDPTNMKSNYILSYIYYDWKDYNAVIQCLDRIKDSADDLSFINQYYGFCYYHLGEYKKAVSFLQDALVLQPTYSRHKDYIEGITLENKLKEVGDLKKAISELEEKTSQIEPEFRDLTKLSMLYIFNNEGKKAEKLLLSLRGELAS